jgi:hypothetical protein
MAFSLLEGYSRRLACLAGQRFLIVLNMRNGPFWRLVQDNVFILWLTGEMVQTVIP